MMPQLADARREWPRLRWQALARLRAAVFPKGVLTRAPDDVLANASWRPGHALRAPGEDGVVLARRRSSSLASGLRPGPLRGLIRFAAHLREPGVRPGFAPWRTFRAAPLLVLCGRLQIRTRLEGGAPAARHGTCAGVGVARAHSGLAEGLMRSSSGCSRLHQALVVERASVMRSALTPSEQALWALLRQKQLGVWFRRQVPIGRFIADFAAVGVRLVVEVDGGYHAERRAADVRRDRALARLGYRVLRLEAALVLEQPLEAIARVRTALA
jgi:very-short-patch-repair endonuclease